MTLSRVSGLICSAFVLVALSSAANAGTSTEEDVRAKIKSSNEKIKKACGCTFKFSIDQKWDMTNGDLLYNAEYQIGSIGDFSDNYCGKGAAHKKKLCAKIKSVAIKSHKAATKTDGKGTAFTSYIDVSNKAQLSNHGDAWMTAVLEE